jgi:hypothetical protein
VPGNAQQLDAERIHIGGNLPYGLCRVAVEENAALAGDTAHLGNGLDSTHLVVGMHDTDENGLRRDRPGHIVGIDPPKAVHRNDADFETVSLQEAAGSKDCRMFN